MKSVKFYLMITLAILIVSSLGFSHEVAMSTSEFSTNQIEAQIIVNSPIDNGSYTSNISLDVGIIFDVFSRDNNGLIPYQDVTCVYQLDNGRYQNASLYYASQQRSYKDIPNNGYWNTVKCNYTASLQGLSVGRHSLTIALQPSGITYYRINAAGLENPPQSPTGYFYVIQPTVDKPTLTAVPIPSSPSEFLAIVILLSVTMAITALVLLLKKKLVH